MSLLDNIKKLLFASITATVTFAGGLLSYAVFYDYIVVRIYNFAVGLQNDSMISAGSVTAIETAGGVLDLIPSILDKLFLFGFLFFLFELGRSVLNSKREGYFSTLGTITYGSIIIMFISGFFGTISEWFRDIIFSLIPTLSQTSPMFTFYLTNLGVINLGLSLFFILLSFVDLKKLKQRNIPNQPELEIPKQPEVI